MAFTLFCNFADPFLEKFLCGKVRVQIELLNKCEKCSWIINLDNVFGKMSVRNVVENCSWIISVRNVVENKLAYL